MSNIPMAGSTVASSSSQATPLLQVEGLCKSYRRPGREPFPAVRGISFAIAPGECFGLLGPNGAGKSTSMNCVTGLYPPTAGSVRIMGLNVHSEPRQARLFLGVCSQEESLDTDFSVLDQLTLHATYFGFSRTAGEARARKLLVDFGLADRADEPVESLSGGMRRRLQVARALVSGPRLLVLDEPTTGLDPEARHVLWDIVRKFRNAGGAILLSTHYMDEAQRLCDRIAILFKGQILDCASPDELITKHVGTDLREEELRPGVIWKRPPNLEDVYLKLTGHRLEDDAAEGEGPDEPSEKNHGHL